jgi:hypothetical protein
VLAGHHERVPGEQRTVVEERDGRLGLGDDRGRDLAADDPAEEAVARQDDFDRYSGDVYGR